jgi:UDP-N-acetylmuramyl pentapeptide phosphotransferase/UDP-N-acetylglucosamine-1-phosphate transferase
MGDVGSLALGGMLAMMGAMLTPPGPQLAMPVLALVALGAACYALSSVLIKKYTLC